MSIRFNPGVNHFADPRASGEAKARRTAASPSQPAASKLNDTFSNFRPENLASKAGAFPASDIRAATGFARARMRSFESDIRQNMGTHAGAQTGAQTPRSGPARGAGGARASRPGPAPAPERFTLLTTWSAPDGRGVHWRKVRDNATGQHRHEFFNPRTRASGHASDWSAPDSSGMRTRSVQDKTGKQWAEHYDPRTGGVSFTYPWSRPDPTGTFSRITIKENGETWHESMNTRTGKHHCSTPFVLQNGVQRRQVYDCQSKQMWHESIDFRTGTHTSSTAWSRPDPYGACTRMMYDHKTGQSHTQVFRPYSHAGSSDYTGKTGNTGNAGGTSGASSAGQEPAEVKKKQEIDNALNVLSLNPATNPTPSQVRSAYRKMMLKWHPDKNADKLEEAQQMSQQINNAKDKLVEHGFLPP